MRLRLSLGPLAEREFRLLFFGRTTSTVGDRLVPIALSFAVLDLTGSVSDLGIVLAAATVPMLLLVPLGGVCGDRLSRKAIMLASDVVRCGSQGLTALLLLTHDARLWQLIVLQAVYGGAEAFFAPAAVGLVPATVAPPRLQQATGLMTMSSNAAGIAGPAIGGALVALASPGAALGVDAATFAASALSLSLLRVGAAPELREGHASIVAELRHGVAEVRSRTWVWAMIVHFGVFSFAAFPTFDVLGPAIAKRSLGGPAAWATILTAASVGAFLGSVLLLRVRTSRPLLLQALLLLFVPRALLLAFAASTIAIAASALLAAGALMWADGLYYTTLMEKIPGASISRVSSIDWGGVLVLNSLGFILVGPISAALGTRTTLIGSAALTAASTLAVLSVPSIRRLRAEFPAPVPSA